MVVKSIPYNNVHYRCVLTIRNSDVMICDYNFVVLQHRVVVYVYSNLVYEFYLLLFD